MYIPAKLSNHDNLPIVCTARIRTCFLKGKTINKELEKGYLPLWEHSIFLGEAQLQEL